ncbi:hypothetical protein MTO96_001159 [Rhipicephalus appendiculatus]
MSCFHSKQLILPSRAALLGGRIQHVIRKQLLCSQNKDQSPLSFDAILSQRRKESSASILVEVENRHKITELCQECSRYGNIRKAYYYADNSHKCQVLLEFSNSDEVQELLQSCGHLSSDGFPIAEQMTQFYQMEKLSDLETRLGFVVCRQVEEFISGLYPKGQVLPFGSLVNGFGRHNCDIDMVYCVPEATESSGQLYFQDKNQAMNDRTLVQRVLETLGDLLHYVVPGVSECDLTLNNMSGVHMSRLLHSCTQLAPALCPPAQCGLLPSLRDLEDKKRLKTWQKSRLPNGKAEELEDLLRSFFEYYASFNFKSKGIAPFSGQTLEKPEYTAMFMQNPLDRQLNASRNIGLSDLKKLQGRMADALSLMDNAPRKITMEKPWGIMALFTAQTAAARRQQDAMHRRFQVHELFQEGKEAGENYVIEATVSGVKTTS